MNLLVLLLLLLHACKPIFVRPERPTIQDLVSKTGVVQLINVDSPETAFSFLRFARAWNLAETSIQGQIVPNRILAELWIEILIVGRLSSTTPCPI